MTFLAIWQLCPAASSQASTFGWVKRFWLGRAPLCACLRYSMTNLFFFYVFIPSRPLACYAMSFTKICFWCVSPFVLSDCRGGAHKKIPCLSAKYHRKTLAKLPDSSISLKLLLLFSRKRRGVELIVVCIRAHSFKSTNFILLLCMWCFTLFGAFIFDCFNRASPSLQSPLPVASSIFFSFTSLYTHVAVTGKKAK